MFISLFTTDKNLVVKTEREKNHLEDPSENGRIILKYSLKDTQSVCAPNCRFGFVVPACGLLKIAVIINRGMQEQLVGERLVYISQSQGKCTVSNMLKKSSGRNWIGLIWLRIGTSDDIL